MGECVNGSCLWGENYLCFQPLKVCRKAFFNTRQIHEMVNYANYEQLLRELEPYAARLVAVSKTQPAADIADLHAHHQVIFGENRVHDLTQKQAALPSSIEWHLIGHLQTNKVKFVAPFVRLIHSIDSLKLLQAVDKEAQKLGLVQDVLLQFHIAAEDTKFGFSEKEARQMLETAEFSALRHVCVCGVMGMATFSDDKGRVRSEFRFLRQLFGKLRQDYFSGNSRFREISMGMSGDYRIALEEGSTMVRVGSLLWGIG
jgi:hypothetical protein